MKACFQDLVVWITGGGSGIGRSLAVECAKQGADVAVSGRRLDRLQSVVDEVTALGRRGAAVPCDVADDDSVKAAVETVVKELGKLDVAVANAGFSVEGRVEKLSGDDWRRQLNTNVVGAAMTAHFALPELRKTDGRMVFVASVMGMFCSPGLAAYSASKYALRALGQTLSMELKGSSVSCTTIHPGFVQSEIDQVDNLGQFHSDKKDSRPQKLMWKAEDAARVMAKAIFKRKREFTFTAHGKVGAWIGRHAPGLVHLAVPRRVERKPKTP